MLSLKMGSAGISAGLLKTVLETLLAAGFITGSEKVETFCFVKTPETEVVTEVKWDEYERIGGCALTEWHHKWVYANKQSRKCRHCGRWERKVVKTVKTVERRTLWESES